MELVLPVYTETTNLSNHINHFVLPVILCNTVGNKYFWDHIIIVMRKILAT